MNLILHITQREQWEQAQGTGFYRGDTLDSEGFIHCSTLQQVVAVANARFHAQEGLVLLCIDAEMLQAELRFDAAEEGERFPHIYGPLNSDAVVKVLPFEPGEDGSFTLPAEIALQP